MAMITKDTSPFPPPSHNHTSCVQTALAAAELACIRNDKRLTPIRRRVLELIWEDHRPIGAYDLLALLQTERERVAPPTVYRALEFLCEEGFVHRLDTLQAYIGCGHFSDRQDSNHAAYFLICQDCGSAAELQDSTIDAAINDLVRRIGFIISGETIELNGLCSACRN